MGWPAGGYQRLIDALERRIVALGGEVRPLPPSTRSSGEAAASPGSSSTEGFARSTPCSARSPRRRRDGCSRPSWPHTLPRIAAATSAWSACCCVVSRSVSPFYHLNITDRRVPLTTIVETTHVVDPDAVGGHLLYVSKYVDPEHPAHDLPEDEVAAEYLGHARTIFPALHDEVILASRLQRARMTEPVHVIGGAKNVPDMFPVSGLALASTTHVYPEMVSGQAVCGVAERVVPGILRVAGRAAGGGGMTGFRNHLEGAHYREDSWGDGGGGIHRIASLRTAAARRVRGDRGRRPLVRLDDQSHPVPREPRFQVRGARLHAAAQASRRVRRVRRDRASRGEEDPALRRRRVDPPGQRLRCAFSLRGGALARRRPDRHLDLGRVRQRDAAACRGRQAGARPVDDAALGLRRLEALRRASRARPGRGARSQGHDPASVQCLRPEQPSQLVGRAGRDVCRGPARRRADDDPR